MAVNVLLNARSKRSAICAIENDLPKHGLKWNATDVVRGIEEKLIDVQNMLCNTSSTGLWLQNVESEIMSKVVEMFVQENAPLLPVHDSAIVREKDVDKLVQRMGECFLSVVEEYTDKEWADRLSVHMKISSTKHQKLLTFSRSMVYNKFM